MLIAREIRGLRILEYVLGMSDPDATIPPEPDAAEVSPCSGAYTWEKLAVDEDVILTGCNHTVGPLFNDTDLGTVSTVD